jgi:hypothetical protein
MVQVLVGLLGIAVQKIEKDFNYDQRDFLEEEEVDYLEGVLGSLSRQFLSLAFANPGVELVDELGSEILFPLPSMKILKQGLGRVASENFLAERYTDPPCRNEQTAPWTLPSWPPSPSPSPSSINNNEHSGSQEVLFVSQEECAADGHPGHRRPSHWQLPGRS